MKIRNRVRGHGEGPEISAQAGLDRGQATVQSHGAPLSERTQLWV